MALFERTPAAAVLTDVGGRLLVAARATLKAHGALRALAAEAREAPDRPLRIGYHCNLSTSAVPPLAAAMSQAAPDVALSFEHVTPSDQLVRITEGDLDVGLMRPPVDAGDLVAETIAADPICVVVPNRHALASSARVSVAALAGQPLLVRSGRPGPAVRYLRARGMTVRIAGRTSDMWAALGLVAAGQGVAVAPASNSTVGVPGIRFIPVDDWQTRVLLGRRPDALAGAAGAFVTAAREWGARSPFTV